jgi:hypothetical protein
MTLRPRIIAGFSWFQVVSIAVAAPGASEIDWLSVIVGWVEQDKSPVMLVASKKERGKVTMTRPLYAYPKVAAYKGSGDPNSAESFEAKAEAR